MIVVYHNQSYGLWWAPSSEIEVFKVKVIALRNKWFFVYIFFTLFQISIGKFRAIHKRFKKLTFWMTPAMLSNKIILGECDSCTLIHYTKFAFRYNFWDNVKLSMHSLIKHPSFTYFCYCLMQSLLSKTHLINVIRKVMIKSIYHCRQSILLRIFSSQASNNIVSHQDDRILLFAKDY